MNKSMKKQGHCWPAVAILLLLLAALALPSSAAAQTGQISGTVKDSSGNLLQDVEVYVYDAEDTSGFPPAPEFTDENGWYEVSSLPFGEHRYKVQFIGNGYIEQWYKDAPMSDCAEPVTITAENTVQDEIDAVLKEGTSSAARRSLAQAQAAPAAAETSSVISGSVSLNGEPLKCAQVEAYDAADDSDWIDQVLTDYQGNYTINELPSGSYKILFYDQNGIAGQWYNRKAEAVCADAVSETASGIDAAFPVSLRQCGDRPTILPAIKLLLN
jgi:hypothetical protein